MQTVAAGLRAATLILRFSLALMVAKFMSLEDAGLFFLYLAGVQLASSLMTLDLYAATVRDILSPGQNRSDVVSRHFGAVCFAILLFGPLLTAGFYFAGETSVVLLSVLFFFHAGFECVLSEAGRLLTPLGRPASAVFIQFGNTAFWLVPLAIYLFFAQRQVSSLNFILPWFCVSMTMMFLCYRLLGKALSAPIALNFDFAWLIIAVKSSFVFFLATLMFRVIVGVDKFIIEHSIGLEAVAIYGTYMAVAFGAVSLLEAGVSAWRYPNLVISIQARDKEAFHKQVIPYLVQNSFAAFMVVGSVAVLYPLAVSFFLAPVYSENIGAFYIMSAGVFLFALSMPCHYIIYGFRADYLRMATMIVALLVLLITWKCFLPGDGIDGAGLMISSTLFSIAVARSVFALSLVRKKLL